jgi:hypothetical protein
MVQILLKYLTLLLAGPVKDFSIKSFLEEFILLKVNEQVDFDSSAIVGSIKIKKSPTTGDISIQEYLPSVEITINETVFEVSQGQVSKFVLGPWILEL